jgi:hypothetical protein
LDFLDILFQTSGMLSKSAQPMGPPRGGKYISRKWNGERWVYQYSAEPSSAHGVSQQPSYTDLSREHSMDVPESAPVSENPEEQAKSDYEHAMNTALTAGSKVPIVHPMQGGPDLEIHPTQNKKGETEFDVFNPEHKTVIFHAKSKGHFEAWYAISSHSEAYPGLDGKTRYTISPIVGTITKDGLVPPDKLRWKVTDVQNPDAPILKKQSRELAQRYVQTQLSDELRLSGGSIPETPTQIESVPPVELTPNTPTVISAPEGQTQPITPVASTANESNDESEADKSSNSETFHIVPGSFEDRIRRNSIGTGGKQWRSKEEVSVVTDKTGRVRTFKRTKVELNVSPEERKNLIEDVAKQYWPYIVKTAKQIVAKNPILNKNPEKQQYWMARLIGTGSELPMQAGYDPKLKEAGYKIPQVIGLVDENSATHKAISRSIDRFDPYKHKSFGGLLAGISGEVFQHMRRATYIPNTEKNDENPRGDLISEALGLATDITSTAGEGFNRLDDPNTIGQASEGRAHLLNPEEALMSGEETPTLAGSSQAQTPIDRWADAQLGALEDWSSRSPGMSSGHADQYAEYINQIVNNVPKEQQNDAIKQLRQIMHSQKHGEHFVEPDFGKSLEVAKLFYAEWELSKAALGILTRDKNVDPSHTYSHKEGDEDHPKHYYRDQADNFVRYTNAPTGHADRHSAHGEAKIHPSEPSVDQNPEYFTPEGKKLSRAPAAQDPSTIEWNQNYNKFDPKNLWAARWRDQDSGEHKYTYVHSDIKQIPKLAINQQNALFDARMSTFRQYYSDLFNSDLLKDKVTAVCLALLDQGRMRVTELSMLTPAEVRVSESVVQLGLRKIHVDERIRSILSELVKTKQKDEPLFAVPQQDKDNNPEDNGLRRRIGPHYLSRVVESQGISLYSIQTYHATVTFVRDVVRYLSAGAAFETAIDRACRTIAHEWGYGLATDIDPHQTVELILQSLVDPIVVELLQQSYSKKKPPQEIESVPNTYTIPHVSMDLTDRTYEEKEFSGWLHSHPIHEHAEVDETTYKSLNNEVTSG